VSEKQRDPDLEPERYELREGLPYRFELGRRGFLQLLGGVVVLVVTTDADGQESGRTGAGAITVANGATFTTSVDAQAPLEQTVIADGALPGELMPAKPTSPVCGLVPRFPADATTTIPARTAASTACTRGSVAAGS